MATYYVNARYANGREITWFAGTLEECQEYYVRLVSSGARPDVYWVDDYPVEESWLRYDPEIRRQAEKGRPAFDFDDVPDVLEAEMCAAIESSNSAGSAPEGESLPSPAPAYVESADERRSRMLNALAEDQAGRALPDPCVSCRHEDDPDGLWCSVCPNDPENWIGPPRQESSRPPDAVQTALTLPMAARTPWDDDPF